MDTITGTELAELLSVTSNNLFYWDCEGLLEPIEAPGPLTYTILAVDAFLAAREHTFASPLTVATLQRDGKVVPRDKAAIALGRGTSAVEYYARKRTAPFVILPLSSAKSERRFGALPCTSDDPKRTVRLQPVTELLDPQAPVTNVTLAVLFGVSMRSIEKWRRRGLLLRPGAIITSAYVRTLLAEHLSPLTTVDEWITLRLTNPEQKLYTVRGGARHLGIEPVTFHRFVQAWQSGYIRLPSGGAWHLTNEVLDAYKAKR